MPEATKKPNIFQRMVQYFKEVKAELKKVVWPTVPQTINNTIIVITCILIVGVILFVLDSIFAGTMSSIITGDFFGGIFSWYK